jgi:hypothetical protein
LALPKERCDVLVGVEEGLIGQLLLAVVDDERHVHLVQRAVRAVVGRERFVCGIRLAEHDDVLTAVLPFRESSSMARRDGGGSNPG